MHVEHVILAKFARSVLPNLRDDMSTFHPTPNAQQKMPSGCGARKGAAANNIHQCLTGGSSEHSSTVDSDADIHQLLTKISSQCETERHGPHPGGLLVNVSKTPLDSQLLGSHAPGIPPPAWGASFLPAKPSQFLCRNPQSSIQMRFSRNITSSTMTQCVSSM